MCRMPAIWSLATANDAFNDGVVQFLAGMFRRRRRPSEWTQ